jgi:hypothetical protein
VPIGAASATDVAWAQLTIALNERALPVIELVLERSANPRLRDFARELKSGLRTETDQIQARLVALGVGLDNPHAGHAARYGHRFHAWPARRGVRPEV